MEERAKIPASVGILTLNSAKELPHTLESVRDFDDVYICDGNSTDGTRDVARRYGARVVKQVETDEPNVRITDFGATRTRCVNAGRYDWHLRVDSDEWLSPEAVEEIRRIIAEPMPRYLVYKMPRKYVLNGKVIDHATTYPNRQMRFFNRRGIDGYEKVTHERVAVRPGALVGLMKNCQYAPLPETYDRFWKKFENGLRFDVAQSADINFSRWLRSSFHCLALAVLYFGRLIKISFRRGTKLPLSYELARQRYLFLTWLVATRNLFRRIRRSDAH
jgi:glycosyltransferase involved in cell wall biosynthesis